MAKTDVIMPHMSGQRLASELVSDRPDLRVLFVSGYGENALVHHGSSEREVAFLPKPYTQMDLLQRVRDVLDQGATS